MAIELAPVLHIEAAGTCIALQLSAGADGQTVAYFHISTDNAENGQIRGGDISVYTAGFPNKYASPQIDISFNGAINPYISVPIDVSLYGGAFIYNGVDFAAGNIRHLLTDAVKHGGFPLKINLEKKCRQNKPAKFPAIMDYVGSVMKK